MRRARRILMWLLGIAVFVAAFGYWQWHLLLERLQVSELQADIESLGLSHLQLNRLQLRIRQGERDVNVILGAADIRWDWQGFTPRPSIVTLADAQVRIDAVEPIEETPPAALELPADWQLPSYIPREVTIDQLELDLPCASGRCDLNARLRSLRVEDSLNLSLTLLQSPSPAQLDVTYRVSSGLPHIELAIRAQDLFELRSQTRLEQPNDLQWQGDLSALASRPSPEWLAYLQAWNPRFNAAWLETFTQSLSASGEWHLALAPLLAHYQVSTVERKVLENAPLNERDKLEPEKSIVALLQRVSSQLDGQVALMLDLPSALPIPQLGDLSGTAKLDLAITRGVITRYELDIDSRVGAPIVPAQFVDYDLALDAVLLKLQSAVAADVDLQALPMQVQLNTQGNLAIDLNAKVQLDSNSLAFVVSDAHLDVAADSWTPLPDFTLDQLKLQQHFSAQWSAPSDSPVDAQATPQQLSVELLSPGEISFNLTSADVGVQGGKLSLEQLVVGGDPLNWKQATLQFAGALQMAELRHSQLTPQSWSWRGKASAADQKLNASGLLIAGGQLNLEHQVAFGSDQLTVDWQLGDVFLLAGKGLQELTPHWPPLLTLSRGRLGGTGRLTWQLPEVMPTGAMSWQLGEVTGIYDTTAFNGASGAVEIKLSGEELSLASDNLTVQEIVQGFVLGPARAAASYSAKMDSLTQGKLTVQQLESDLLGGRISVPAGELDFSQASQALLLEVADIDLARLLSEHPAGDLVGSGRISGRIPLELSASGIEVAKGTLSAAEPGGRLQYRSERAAALAASSPSMKLVTDALDDFRYTVLSSEVTYSDTGTLILGVRLEGSSPAVESGRPIHFNINLEEDLPALIYSLQLTNQLSEVIKKRVQEKMRAQAEVQTESDSSRE